jgi:hypothetical protein
MLPDWLNEREILCKHCGYPIEWFTVILPDKSYWKHKYQYGIDPHCMNEDFTKRETVAAQGGERNG